MASRTEHVVAGVPQRIIGSDAVEKGGVVARCPLCHQFGPIVLGHVIPRWAGRWAKEEGPLVGHYESVGAETRSRDYPKHYILCRSCDSRLGEAENYLARLSRGTPRDLEKISVHLTLHDHEPFLSRVRVPLVMRAVVGIMFKSHFAPSFLFQRMTLPITALEELRIALLTDTYPGQRFHLFAAKWVASDRTRGNPRSVMSVQLERISGGYFFEPLMAGNSWSLFVGPAEWREEVGADEVAVRRLFLEPDRPWVMPVLEWTEHRHIAHHAGLPLTEDGYSHEWTGITRSAPCPCGLAASFGDCCWGRWLEPGLE